jgi:hypothetical protein
VGWAAARVVAVVSASLLLPASIGALEPGPGSTPGEMRVGAAATAPPVPSAPGPPPPLVVAAPDREAPPVVRLDGLSDVPPSTTPPAPTSSTSVAAATISPAPGRRRTFALVVAVDDYPGAGSDLEYSVGDAQDVLALLDQMGVAPEQRQVLLDRAATRVTVLGALDRLAAEAGPDDLAVLFFAGHVRKLSHTTEAFVAADGALVRDREVADHLAPLRAPAWIIFATCYGGGFTETLAPGRVLTAASDASSLAYESRTFHRSYLVEYLIHRALLDHAADGTVEAAFAWAERQLRREHPERAPVQWDLYPGDLRLDGVPADAPAPEAPVAPPPAPPSTTTTTAPSRSKPSGCLVNVALPCR